MTITKMKQLMPFREIIALQAETLMKWTNMFSERNAELLIVRAGGTYSTRVNSYA
jgi:hypothetical protein